MTILVTGSTGRIGTQVVQQLARGGRAVRAMMARYQRDGAVAAPEDLSRLTTLLGRPPRRYRDFAAETARSWQA